MSGLLCRGILIATMGCEGSVVVAVVVIVIVIVIAVALAVAGGDVLA